jgi:hypothetical protein
MPAKAGTQSVEGGSTWKRAYPLSPVVTGSSAFADDDSRGARLTAIQSEPPFIITLTKCHKGGAGAAVRVRMQSGSTEWNWG